MIDYKKCDCYPQCMSHKCECMETAVMINTTMRIVDENRKVTVIEDERDFKKAKNKDKK